MPLCGATLELVRTALPVSQVDRVLDLGCGAGAVGLLLARAARQVVATDIQVRALAFARFNATLNAIPNIELRLGDGYEPVRGERFDRIACQPPFHAQRDGETRSVFTHGGRRGDELPLRVLTGVLDHLTDGGRAVFLGDWPVADGDPLDVRARGALGGRGNLLVLQSPLKNLDEYCALHAAIEHRELGQAFARAALAHRDHLEALRLRGISVAWVVVEPCDRGTPWTSLLAVRHVSDAPLTARALDRMMAARSLAFAGPAALASARLRLPDGARLVEQPVPGAAAPAVVVQLPAGRPEWPVVLDARVGSWVARIAQASRVGDDGDAITAAREALLAGALDSVP